MNGIVISPFTDVKTQKNYDIGQIFSGEKNRIINLEKLGLIKVLEEKKIVKEEVAKDDRPRKGNSKRA